MEVKRINGPGTPVQPAPKAEEQPTCPPPWWEAKRNAIEVRARIQRAFAEKIAQDRQRTAD